MSVAWPLFHAHLPILPILLPLLAGLLMLFPPLSKALTAQRLLGLASILLQGLLAVLLLLQTADGQLRLYALGQWPAPFGIMLMVDQLGALMLLLTAVLALGALLYACAGSDVQGSFFHPLFQLQLLGINGAFLTGDLFNLFVFFEVLLMASYSLLMHGENRQRTRAALHYVILNLVGSSIFLIALGTLYGTLGTLNMADMAVQVKHLDPTLVPLVKAGALMLLIVFALKAAMLPLHFWLARTYAEASPAVAALFCIMTKVGIYAILRVYSLIFGDQAGPLADLAAVWLWPLALLTLIIGAISALTSSSLRKLNANLIIVSVGTLLAVVALNDRQATAAALVYLIHSTLITAGVFLLAAMIAEQRGRSADHLVAGRPMAQPLLLGVGFVVAALALIGMPPFSGFIGKLMILQATAGLEGKVWLWPCLLLSSLIILVAMSRAGTTLFWRINGEHRSTSKSGVLQLAGVSVLLLAAPLITFFAADLSQLTSQISEQLYQPQRYIDQVFPMGEKQLGAAAEQLTSSPAAGATP
ncbi:monovalent cation/H+ antiporter subunit D [Pokkaliibacter plantistimulans]|uniref:Monovalent cation/H+ antiporter subunit D n=1 Tax=Proteobacteria bacterium 228 TaxID=2083153 RepID=A0A2S5KT45_9PROT|nr:monovalent cation/H+ antiporter subunit D [Pokkaliibacter plantistimulans]PPC77842.1 monovalent cation/H+ antiporter subunit D [Pokkaliibacter plantistimulans]